MRPVVCFLIASLAAFEEVAGQSVGCTDPTPDERNWWHWERSAHADSSNYFTSPRAPALTPPKIESLPGRYRLTLVHTLGDTSRVSGYLVLRPHDDHDSPSGRFLRGYLEGLDSADPFVGAPVAPSSDDGNRPGVEMVYRGHSVSWSSGLGTQDSSGRIPASVSTFSTLPATA